MFTVLIVDDEPLICKGVAAMIPWEELGIRQLGTAGNGEEALGIIREKKPDIVIADIHMPVMDGLMLIEECCKESLCSHFILLTGYKEFDYARKAMNYGVKRYILKPTDPKLLRTALEEEVKEVRQEQEALKTKDKIQRKLKKVAPKAAEQYWYECLKFNRCFSAELSYYVPLEQQNRECVCIVMYIEEKAPYFELFILKNLVYEIISPLYPVFCIIMGNHLAVIVEHKPDREFILILYQIKQLFTGYFNKNLMISISPRGSYRMIPKLYEKAVKAVDTSFWSGGDEILLPENSFKHQTAGNSTVDLGQYKTQIAVSSVAMMEEVVTASLQEIKESSGTVKEGKQMILQLYLMVKKYLGLNHGGIDIYDVDYIIQANSFRSVEKIFENIFAEYRGNQDGGISVQQRTIERVKSLVEEHLSEEALTLKWIARKYLFMNEEYLGKLFIQYTGMRFSAYVTRLRIGYAKRLLKEVPDIRIMDLSQRTGFGRNSAYFSTVFKSATGVSPSEFKDILKGL